ncbi:metal-sulfur cluster assembly factor [Companilactobacillus musae]|uniref:metal-sulfur cluster assembly factor n=1 Tax=Companilactobacillus musae TaxID=1903258 RepID=UPI000E65D488|nr:metal-sulfur cluster assembly factor [Companilactobacillus musae]
MEENIKKEQVVNALKQVIDPELGIDIVNLGLIYEVEIENGNRAIVTMTLTTMGCPLSDMLNDMIKQAIESVQGITESEIQVVWYPMWSISKMTSAGRTALGIPEDYEG